LVYEVYDLKKYLGRFSVIALTILLSLYFLYPSYRAHEMEKQETLLAANEHQSPEDSVKYADWLKKNNEDFIHIKK